MSTHPSRSCPVCGGNHKKPLFHQTFARLSEGSLLDGYDVVVCGECGMGYADGIPPQSEFDRYYASMSKYEFADRAGVQNEWDLQRFGDIASILEPYTNPAQSILDFGCATGGQLAEFKRRGFQRLLGVDPSSTCAQATQELYGVNAESRCLSSTSAPGEQHDLVLMIAVLEHLRDVRPSLESMKQYLRPGGLLYVELPDAARYHEHFSAPFQFFSMEHINFFSATSLKRLLGLLGFSCVFTRDLVRALSPAAMEPTIAGLFRYDDGTSLQDDNGAPDELELHLVKYIHQSQCLHDHIVGRINQLVSAGRPLAIWGTGSHTLRLMETSSLMQARVVAFLDSNANYQGKSLAGVPVMDPKSFHDDDVDVLISSAGR